MAVDAGVPEDDALDCADEVGCAEVAAADEEAGADDAGADDAGADDET